jgi:putative Ca2+/H+ antiporter (TMEM165/GDT1 family)
MFWFWFWRAIAGLMIVADLACWMVALRLANRRRWRVLVNVFMAAQLAAHLSVVAGLDWPSHVPKAVLVAAMVWHYLALVSCSPFYCRSALFALARGWFAACAG